MRKIFIIIFLLWFLAVFQQSFFFSFHFASFNLVLVAVFLLSFFKERNKLLIGFLGGLILDLVSVSLIGTFAFSLLLVSFLVKKMTQIFYSSNILSIVLTFVFSFFIYKLSYPLIESALLFLNFKGLQIPSFQLSFSLFGELALSTMTVGIGSFLVKKYVL